MRLTLIKWFFLISLSLIVIRLFYWQVIKADELLAKAETQRFADGTILPKRGSILYRDGSYLALTQPTFNLFANPKLLGKADKDKLTLELAKIFSRLDFSEESEIRKQVFPIKVDLDEKLSQDKFWIQLRKNLSYDTKLQIESLGVPGVGFDESFQRLYPEGSSSAHLLGFVASDDRGLPKGYFGLEGFFDGELRGIAGFSRIEKDAQGLPILIGKFFNKEPSDGKDLILNIDRTVQSIIERRLKEGIEKYGAKAGSAVVMDPFTGEILAMAAFPNYDPGNFTEFPKQFFKNSVVADQYEPGSTFKVLTMAAGLNEGAVKPDTKCEICDKPLDVGDYTIRTWNNKYNKDATMKEVIVHSDNVGMVFMARKLGLDKMYQYIQDFGFGKLTGIDLQDEFSPEIRLKKDWRDIDLATSSFGQGIAVTPIQMVRAVSAIANGGNLMEPHIVRQIRDMDKMIDIKPKVIKRVITQETAKQMTEMMFAAVEEGEARVYAPKDYKIAGKTGTAQIPVAGHYDAEHTIASFVGFAPIDKPKFVMLVRYDQPTSSIYGADTAAPTFFKIASELFLYFGITP